MDFCGSGSEHTIGTNDCSIGKRHLIREPPSAFRIHSLSSRLKFTRRGGLSATLGAMPVRLGPFYACRAVALREGGSLDPLAPFRPSLAGSAPRFPRSNNR
jgi:hypothetical protein